jgi:RNA polymerase sigma factor (sigma-70 family)
VLAINDALQALRAMNHRQAQVVELRFFGGMTIRQTAVALDISESTVEDDWRFARAWLSTRLSNGGAA